LAQQQDDPIYSSDFDDDIYTILWNISYTVQHMLIFLVTCGLILDDMTASSIGQHTLQTVIVFAVSAAIFQALLLHALPHIIYGVVIPSQHDHLIHRTALRSAGIQFLIRTPLYSLAFALEFCIVWLVARNLIFTKEHLAIYRHVVFVFVFVVAVTLHILLEQQLWNKFNVDQLDDQATVLLSSDDDGASEDTEDISVATSIDVCRIETISTGTGSHEGSTNPTERMPFVVLRGFALTNAHAQSISSTNTNSMNSPKSLNLQWEFMKLLLLLDTLFVSYSFMVIYHGGSTGTMMIVILTVLVSIGFAIATYLYSAYDGFQTQHSNDLCFMKGTNVDDEKRLSFIKSFQTYNSIDV
jgi:hypothetical protein